LKLTKKSPNSLNRTGVCADRFTCLMRCVFTGAGLINHSPGRFVTHTRNASLLRAVGNVRVGIQASTVSGTTEPDIKGSVYLRPVFQLRPATEPL
jgi:hypothetical protein